MANNRRQSFISDYRTAVTMLQQAMAAVDGLTGEYQAGGYAAGGSNPITDADFAPDNADIALAHLNDAIASFAALKTFVAPAHYGKFVRVRKP